MPGDFKSFLNNKGKVSKEDMNRIKQNFSDSDIKNIENFTKKYDNMSEGQIMNEIMQMASSSKKSGSLKNSDIDNFVNNIMPMLNNEQKAKLSQVVQMLKKQ